MPEVSTTMKILDGKKLSLEILERLKKEIAEKKLKLKLAVVLVGQNPASVVFVRQKEKACQKVGIDFKLFNFSSKIGQEKLKKEVRKIANNPAVSGIVIQLPLPKKINSEEILKLIPLKKNVERISPVVEAIRCFLKEYKISLEKKRIVLIGRGRLVGQPVAKWLEKKKIKFSDINEIKKADIVISGVGKPNLIKGNMVKRGVVVLDVGADVDFKSVSKKAKYITPVPGGVGPVVVACLLQNLVWIYTCSNKSINLL